MVIAALTARKKPLQERAQLTVEAILRATARLLVSAGYERTNTNRIARMAGVSVGSLYQYFPNKESIVSALLDRHCDEMLGLLGRAVVDLVGAPLEQAVRTYVCAMLETHAKEPQLHRVFVEELPRVDGLTRLRELNAEAQRLVRTYLEAHRRELRALDLDTAAFILVYAVEAVAHAALVEAPERLSSACFANEVAELVLRYLAPAAPPARREVSA